MQLRRRPALRAMIRDYCLEHIESHPDCTEADAIPDVKDRLRSDFGATSRRKASPWLGIMLMLVEYLLPLLLNLFKYEDAET